MIAYHYKYWYQEQEHQTNLDLNRDSFIYRNYDYAICRFMSLDPLAEKYPSLSPFAYTYGNPVRFVDPTGMEGEQSDWKPVQGLRNVWKAEAGDNVETLARDAGISTEAARKVFDSHGLNYDNVEEGYYVLTCRIALSTELSGRELKPIDLTDELISGLEHYTSSLNNKGGYVVISTAESRRLYNRIYWKPNARGLNFVKGSYFSVSQALRVAGPVVSIGLEVPDIYNGYQISAHEGNKQVAGAVGSLGGGWLGGMAAGAVYFGIAGAETGPFDIFFVAFGACIGAYLGEEGVEKLYEKVCRSRIKRNYNSPTFLNGYYGSKF